MAQPRPVIVAGFAAAPRAPPARDASAGGGPGPACPGGPHPWPRHAASAGRGAAPLASAALSPPNAGGPAVVWPSTPLPPLHHTVLAGRGAAPSASAAACSGRTADAAAPSPGALLAPLLHPCMPGACVDCELAAGELSRGCGTGADWCGSPQPVPCPQRVRTSPGALGSGNKKPLLCLLYRSVLVRGTAGCSATGAQRGCGCSPGQAPLTHKRFCGKPSCCCLPGALRLPPG